MLEITYMYIYAYRHIIKKQFISSYFHKFINAYCNRNLFLYTYKIYLKKSNVRKLITLCLKIRILTFPMENKITKFFIIEC